MTLRRGLTLIEVLLAIALLSVLAGVVASSATDVRRAASIEPWRDDTLQLGSVADAALEQTEMPVRMWPEMYSEQVSAQHGDSTELVDVRRTACPDCPESIGLFVISANEQSVRRFAPVAQIPAETAP